MYFDILLRKDYAKITVFSERSGQLDEYTAELYTYQAAAIYLFGLKHVFPGIKATERGADAFNALKRIVYND
jgi:hypothetical protein